MLGDSARSGRGCFASWPPYRLRLPCCARHVEDRAPGACWIARVDAKAFGLLFLADIAGGALLRRMSCGGAHDWDARVVVVMEVCAEWGGSGCSRGPSFVWKPPAAGFVSWSSLEIMISMRLGTGMS
jgi:hypothetical protein